MFTNGTKTFSKGSRGRVKTLKVELILQIAAFNIQHFNKCLSNATVSILGPELSSLLCLSIPISFAPKSIQAVGKKAQCIDCMGRNEVPLHKFWFLLKQHLDRFRSSGFP